MPSTNIDSIPSAMAASWVDRVFVPLAVLALMKVAFFSGIVSFRLRPNMGIRMLPVMGMCFAGIVAGALLFPRIAAWAMEKGRRGENGGRWMTMAWLLFALAAVLPGFEHDIANEPLRYVANFAMGTMAAPTFHFFFTRFPLRTRGLWYGLTEAIAILVWIVFFHLATGTAKMEAPPYHPLLHAVYLVHISAIALFTVFCLYAFPIRGGWSAPDCDGNRYAAACGRATPRKAAISLLCVGFAVFLLSGVLQARLTPLLISPGWPVAAHLVMGLIMAMAGIVIGRLVDRRDGEFARLVFTSACWLFLIAPCLTALADNQVLHTVLQGLVVLGQYAFYIVCMIAVAALANNAREAVVFPCFLLVARSGTIFGTWLWNRFGVTDQGVTFFAATVVAGLAFFLMRRIEFGTEQCTTGIAGDPPPTDTGTANNTMEKFLSSVALTPRERETARLLLQGMTTKSIALQFEISDRAVTKHMTGIFRKFGIANRRGLYAAYLATLTGQTASGLPVEGSGSPFPGTTQTGE